MGTRGEAIDTSRARRPDAAVVVNAGTAHIELLGSTARSPLRKPRSGSAARGRHRRVLSTNGPAPAASPPAHAATHVRRSRATSHLVESRAAHRWRAPVLDVTGSGNTARVESGHAALDACAAIAAAHGRCASIARSSPGSRAKPAGAWRGEVVEVRGA
jgi:UDP-N-acetylmuramyl pentapeptide synthase